MNKNSEDHNLVKKVSLGDRQAFAKLYEKYHGKIYRFALSYLHSESDAEDIVHDVFVKLWESRSRLRPDRNFDAYFFTISKNHILNRLRNEKNRLKYHKSIQEPVNIYANPVLEEMARSDYEHIYSNALKSLPERQKQVYLLSREEGLTYKEIAQKLGISKNTVDVHIVRALKAIRDYLNKQGDQRLRTLLRS